VLSFACVPPVRPWWWRAGRVGGIYNAQHSQGAVGEGVDQLVQRALVDPSSR